MTAQAVIATVVTITQIITPGLTLTDLGGTAGLYGSSYQTSNTMLSLGGTGHGAYYWLATSYDTNRLYYFNSGSSYRYVSCTNNSYAFGVRALVSLESGVKNTGGNATSGWDIGM